MDTFETIRKVGEAFRVGGTLYTYDAITNGNINSTYRVTYRCPGGQTKAYIFQRINTAVFSNPVEIMRNIEMITSHIREKYPNERTLHFHHTGDGKNYVFDDAKCFWRVMNWVDSVTFNTCDDPAVIAATGKAFGKFQRQLSDFDGSRLYETIPDFHNTKKRLDTLFEDVAADKKGRVSEVREEIEYISSVRWRAGELSVRFANGEFPVRVTHNDTKCNNVLFDRVTKLPIVVIDLDTVMPGMAMYDFGDAVRSIANTADEDEPELKRVYFDTGRFRAFCKGFIGETQSILTPKEIDALVPAAFSITIELAGRFLDDYINGDVYFKINYPQHNLVRARCQMALARDIARKEDELRWIVEETVKDVKEK